MAAYCPKCNYKLRIRDWRQNCPKCGVNILYYGIEDRLREEADKAEYNHAKSQPKWDRLKFSLYGHPLTIVRHIVGILPILAMLLPMGTVNYILPFLEKGETVNIVSVVMYFVNDGLDVNLLLKLFSSELIGKAMICWAIAVVMIVLILLWTIVGGVCALCLTCSPKGFKRNIVFPSVGIAFGIIGFVAQIIMNSTLSAALPGIYSGTVAPWALIGLIFGEAVIILINIIYKKKNIPVKYTDVSELLLPYNERPSTIEKNRQKAEAEAAKKAEAPSEGDKTE